MRRVEYDERQYEHYARGRALTPEGLDVWMTAFADLLPEHRPLDVLDLGSGTGRFTSALARTSAPAVGVEPSDRMRRSPSGTVAASTTRVAPRRRFRCPTARSTTR